MQVTSSLALVVPIYDMEGLVLSHPHLLHFSGCPLGLWAKVEEAWGALWGTRAFV